MATYQIEIEGDGLQFKREVSSEYARRIMNIVLMDEHDRTEQAAQDIGTHREALIDAATERTIESDA